MREIVKQWWEQNGRAFQAQRKTMDIPWEVPHVRKEAISLIAIADALEAMALRSVLERFNYRVEVQWVGSRQEVLEILRGNIVTFPYVILSCHGDGEGAMLVPGEPGIPLAQTAITLPNRLVLNLGCGTGSEAIAANFLAGECRAYIAPVGEVEGASALLFAIHLFYGFWMKMPLMEAVAKARTFDAECGRFQLWRPSDD